MAALPAQSVPPRLGYPQRGPSVFGSLSSRSLAERRCHAVAGGQLARREAVLRPPPASRQGRSLAAAGGTRSRVRPPFCEPLAPGSGWLGTRREQPLEQEAVCGHHFVSPCFALKAVHHGPPSHLWLVDELTYGILGNMLV